MRWRLLGVCASLFTLACTSAPAEPQASEAQPAPVAPAPTQTNEAPIEPAPVEPAPVEPPPAAPQEQPAPSPAVPTVDPLELPEGPIPEWCEITLKVVTAEQLDRAGVCQSIEEPVDDCSTEDSAWISEPEVGTIEWELWNVALLIPRGPDRFERVLLDVHSCGLETRRELQYAEVRADDPLDASIVIAHTERYCEGETFEDRDCTVEDEDELLIAVTRLRDGRFLLAEALVNLRDRKAHGGFQAARVVVGRERVDVWACDGHARLPLPDDAATEPEAPTPAPTSNTPPPTADETKTAGKRCNEGWSHFRAGELAAAKLEIDAALAVLERAEDPAGKRSLGACLYNRGRIAEQEGDLAGARELYQRSLAARPNDTVQERLDSL